MATAAHCLYCFEVLFAALTNRDAPSLGEVQNLWDEYNTESEEPAALYDPIARGAEGEDKEDENEDEEDTAPGLGEISTRSQSGSSLRKEEDHVNTLAQSLAQKRSGGKKELRAGHLPTSRLLDNVSSSASSSSLSTRNGSTPSLQSNASSTSTPNTRSSRNPSALDLVAESSPKVALGPAPMFVTWNTIARKSGSQHLRGCIGTFDPLPLEKGLATYATTSAFEDTRFSPISYNELWSLSCSVTLLTDFEPAPSPLAWTLGVHGLRISFIDKGRRYSATYLPNVAPEQGWNEVETMISLMRKAGWSGRSADWQRVGELKVVRYQGKKISMDWQEWDEWRAWAARIGAI